MERRDGKILYPKNFLYICIHNRGGLAQLARALAWHARGHEFESRILHRREGLFKTALFCWMITL